MKPVVFLAFAVCCVSLRGSAAPVENFSFSAVDYAPGEALSGRGVKDADWSIPKGVSATNVWDGASNGIAFATGWTNAVALVADNAAATEDFRQIDFSINADLLSDGLNHPLDCTAALSPARDADGAGCFAGWCAGAWQELSCDGADELVRGGGWLDGRIELKTVDGARYVSYLVKVGGEWARLKSSFGRAWFATQAEAPQTACGVIGKGRLASVAVASDEALRTKCYYWIGGASGDWNAATNWSLTPGGMAAEKAPDAAGEAGVVTGRVEITHGKEKAVADGAVVSFGSDGTGEMIDGKVVGKPTLDTDRPTAGRPLVPVTPTLFGRSAEYLYRWYRADYDKKSFGWQKDDTSFVPQATDYEHWLRMVAFDGATAVVTNTFLFSRLPVCYMTTDDGLWPSKEKEEHSGTLRVQGGERYGKQYEGAMKIKVRGNTTASASKKPYKIKLGDKTDMFKFGKQKHWVLLANAFDLTSQRNKLAYDLADDVGVLGMDSTWVVCTLNGSYLGLYQFCEHIRPDGNRVPVYDWSDAAGKVAEKFAEKHGLTSKQEDALAEQLETNLTWVTENRVTFVTNGVEIVDKASVWKKYTDDITSGHILEFSTENDEVTTFRTDVGKLQMKTMVNAPEYLKTNATMFDWVKGIMKDYWGACTSADRCVPKSSKYGRGGKHYSEFCDVGSMVGFTLVNELFTNQDACQKSRYCYIEKGKITWGPVWDFDWGSASIKVSDTTKPYGVTNRWIAAKSDNNNSMIAEWSADFYFCQKLHAAYWANRERFGRIVAEGGDMDENRAYIREAAEANDKKWGSSRKFAEDNRILRENLTARLRWLDKQFSSVTNLIESFRSNAQSAQSTWNPNAESKPTTDEQGREVPSIPLEWVRKANVGADASFAYATEKRLNAAVTNAPSAWGKPTPLWEDYVAGTNPDPNGTNAVFEVLSFAVTNGVPYIRWTPDLGTKRSYDILGCEDLGDDWRTWQPGDRFFKVGVSLPK